MPRILAGERVACKRCFVNEWREIIGAPLAKVAGRPTRIRGFEKRLLDAI